MATLSNNDIARAIYLASKDKSSAEQSELSRGVVKFLAKKRLLGKAPEILEKVEKMIDRDEGRVVGRVSSVEKLSASTKDKISQFLQKRYGAREVVLKESLNETLLGGLRLEVNGEVIDLSIKNKINKLEEYLTR